ncbi:hypothetical protein E1B28_003399 [Marasmius oreades]|uniref:Protein kinase domain-containing protein n=1 Tax=Marasmius oreades TaxID=181124 RepID=A0A9P7RMD8_9AGAR|nr:uncharacterized protein E1B28_003399 [Marasmius oreades]KAG7085866.1 hypothetical protein E1B28_003399 [Marasmius oreades]
MYLLVGMVWWKVMCVTGSCHQDPALDATSRRMFRYKLLISPNARGRGSGEGPSPSVGRGGTHDKTRVYGTQNNNTGGGAQHNYSGEGQFINHGRNQNVNAGPGSFSINDDVARPVQNELELEDSQTTARTFGQNQVLNHRDGGRRNPFHRPTAPRKTLTDREILEWMNTIIGDENRLNRLLGLRETKAEWALEDMQRASYSPECNSSMKSSILDVILWLSEASGRCVQCHYNPNVEKVENGPASQGIFADMWRGRIGGSSEIVALKVVRPRHTPGLGEKLKANMREITKWRKLDHRNVLPFIGCFYLGTSTREICLVSPWMESGNLVDYLQINRPELWKRFSFAWDIAAGLEYLHGLDITHGNLKGTNVLITSDGEVACITDFGLVQILNAGGMSGYIRPTPWCAPEVLVEGSITQKSDIYAYGCVCHENVLLSTT